MRMQSESSLKLRTLAGLTSTMQVKSMVFRMLRNFYGSSHFRLYYRSTSTDSASAKMGNTRKSTQCANFKKHLISIGYLKVQKALFFRNDQVRKVQFENRANHHSRYPTTSIDCTPSWCTMALSTQATITVSSSPRKAGKTRDSGTNLTT